MREHIWKYCEEAIGDWDFDGLKLDFIDSFRLTQETAERAGINCESLEEGIRRLTEGLKEKLVRIKPDVLSSFRQAYIGPSMQSLGNSSAWAIVPVRRCKIEWERSILG